MNEEVVKELNNYIKDLSPGEGLALLTSRFENKTVFSTSLGWEDQVITHIIYSNDIRVKIFTIDTGRLFPEVYSTLHSTNEYYDKKIEVYFPQTENVEKLVNEKGPFSFYESVANRQECCQIRKVEPLGRALKGMSAWVTGIRREQSLNRNTMQKVEWDEKHQVLKYHPLLEWSLNDVKEFIRKHNVPYNRLHDKGFVSIGCAPCTRAIKEGDDFRAGRWWWEDSSKKECGLHVH